MPPCLGLLVFLQLIQIRGTLPLPAPGAALIGNGVVDGDNGSITRTVTVMIVVAPVQIAAALGAVSPGSRDAMAMGRDIRSVVFRRVLDFSARMASAARVFSLLDEKEQAPDPVRPERPRGHVRFHRVSFRCAPETPLIEEVSLSVGPGSTVAIVGPTGAGKTIAEQSPDGFYEVDSGHSCSTGPTSRHRDGHRAGWTAATGQAPPGRAPFTLPRPTGPPPRR
ncbi:hypothetical protein [Streptomyces sp. NPDC088725]|uniref:hypothetical protein n=1 Tax=Streptomyces sp. NPDC088725 TaxID=3365873 RepID=UPI0037FAE3C4